MSEYYWCNACGSRQPIHLCAGNATPTGNDLQLKTQKPSVGNSKAQLIRNFVDLYDEYTAHELEPTLRGFISYLRGQL